MVLQGGIKLDIAKREVYANIDLDTGLIGFTEVIENETIEYFYGGSPKEFKIAFVDILQTITTDRPATNFKISIKNKEIRQYTKHLSENA